MTVNPNAIVVIDPQRAVEDAKNRRDIVVSLRQRSILREGTDFGIVPGTAKPTLLKPGAERLCAAFGLNPQFETIEKVERWEPDNPMFFYRVLCRLIHIESGMEVATGIGSCNSLEVKYRWRWVNENEVPPHLDKRTLLSRSSVLSEFDFAVEKAETGGKYGKPAAYWQQFKDAIASGTARSVKRKTSNGKELAAWEIGGTVYRIPNDDVFSLVNTIDKMACKRALVAAALIGANASEFFTQDVEDMPGFGVSADGDDVVEGHFTEEPAQGNSGHANGNSQPPPTPWTDDADKWNAFLASAQERFQMTPELVNTALKRIEGLPDIPDWTTARGWALAGVVAYGCDYNPEAIGKFTSTLPGDANANYDLNTRALKVVQMVQAQTDAEFAEL